MELQSSGIRLPDEFKNLTTESLGEKLAEKLFATLTTSYAKPISIRLNSQKLNSFFSGPKLFTDIISKSVSWCDNAFYLASHPNFTLDPVFNAGGYYVQDASCMFMEMVWKCIFGKDKVDNLRVLDLCAAPGGKTTLLSSLIHKYSGNENNMTSSLLVANEVIGSRALMLADNVSKWGDINTIVTNNDPSHFSKINEFFDFIAVDAPCSGEGMFRKNPDAIYKWSKANVDLCAARQKRIINDIWPALIPGGILVYSTCTFNRYENDDNVRYILDEYDANLLELDDSLYEGSGIIKTHGGGYQFIPGCVEGEGQYFAIIRKNGVSTKYIKNPKRDSAFNLYEERKGDLIKLYPECLKTDINILTRNLRIISSGTAAGVVKGKDLIPHADLALSIYREQANAYLQTKYKFFHTSIEVSKQEALSYLAKERLSFGNLPKGYILLTYNGLGLGYIKNIGNRINNLLPNARRIRMTLE